MAGLNFQANRIFLNDGAGIFTDSGQALGAGASESVALGDVDGDLDMTEANDSGPVRIYFNLTR